eukprot:10416516-Lingulodinium_polyedra.AAC.1
MDLAPGASPSVPMAAGGGRRRRGPRRAAPPARRTAGPICGVGTTWQTTRPLPLQRRRGKRRLNAPGR